MYNNEYWTEVKNTAECIAEQGFTEGDSTREEAEELINDWILHEYIDSHEWVIYNHNHLPILQHSDNENYMVANLGGAAEVLESDGISGLHCALAFWAFYGDIQDYLEEALDKQEAKQAAKAA